MRKIMFLKLLMRPLSAGRCDKFRIFYHRLYQTDSISSTINEPVPGVSISQIKQSLKQKQITTVEGHACIIIECPICDFEKLKKAKIYINKTTGYFMCDKCSSKGEWNILEKFLLLTKSSKTSNTQKELETLRNTIRIQEDYVSKWDNITKSNQQVADLSPDLYEKVLHTFSLPKISQQDISQLNGVYAAAPILLYFPLIAFGNIVVGYKTLSSESGLEQTIPICNVGGFISYKQKSTRTDGTAVVVPTIDDLLALASQKAANVIICLPYNLQNLPQQLLPSLIYFVINFACFASCDTISKEPTVLIAILVRNKAHTLPYFLSLLERQDYPKKRICLWIRSDNNVDRSIEILNKWISLEGEKYHSLNVQLNATSTRFEDERTFADWSPRRFAHVIDLREQALNYAREIWADFIWMLDADVFLTNSSTLHDLVLKEQTVVAPLLRSDGMYSNFWAGMTAEYYYVRTDLYEPILFREKTGCHNVPMVHSAVLVDLRRFDSDRLTYKAEKLIAYNGPEDDIITFAVGANKSDVPLFVCNDEIYGFVMVPLENEETITEDMQRLINTKVEILAFNDYLPLSDDLKEFVMYPEKDTLGLDQIYMINLIRRPERRKRMHRLFDELGIRAEIINAVDGRTLNESSLKKLGVIPMPEYSDPYHKRPMTMGEIGCFLSHYIIWQKMLEDGYKSVMVLEDDVRFEPFFRQKVNYVLAELSDLGIEWDLVYMGRKRLVKSESPVEGSKFLLRAAYSYWTLGYILSESGAKKLIGAMPLGKLVPVDEYLPILSDKHPKEQWAAQFPIRDLIILSTNPLLIYPTHYTGEDGHISDTEDSKLVQNTVTSTKSGDRYEL